MPVSSAKTTSGRLLSLLSLLQSTRDWPGWKLAERLDVSERTVRRDIDRLRELGYEIRALKGREGGYRLDAGSAVPPMLFDDEQVVAIAIALQTAGNLGAEIEEPAARALNTVRQFLPNRLRARVDAVKVTAVRAGDGAPTDQARTDVLLAIGAAIRNHEELRFDYSGPGADRGDSMRPPRQVQPHHLVAHAGRWYLVAWNPGSKDWRIYRADRIAPRLPNGPRFVARDIPGGDVGAFLAARFKGSTAANEWPCHGDVILHTSAIEIMSFADDAVVEAIDVGRCRVQVGSWSWAGIVAWLARFDADIDVLGPPELHEAFALFAARAARASSRHE
ncbi:WYL domain-containing protein [Nocardia sp. NPDC049707]|uniref:helix-turn-helix transcriptional regulator n=1 Tax=Nocardia sp. NPDC049707 TaxID=3154735 RepID=UPI00341637A7